MVRLLGHRVEKKKKKHYLCRWHGKDTNGKPWPDSYQPEENITSDLIDEYESSLELAPDRKLKLPSLKPVIGMLRRGIARAVSLDKVRAEPIFHDLPFDICALEPIGLAVLDILAEIGGVDIESGEVDGLKFMLVKYTDMDMLHKFCAFEHFISGDKAYGAIRYDIGRTSNLTVSCVAIPVRFELLYNRATPGTVSFSVKFPTVRFEGMYGTPTAPQLAATHMLKHTRTLDRVVQYVKDNLPSTHPLVGKGWTELPKLKWELDAEVAVEA